MKTERDLFEELPYIKSRLDDVFFIDEENTYLPHQWDDADSVNNMHFINGAWYAFQEQQKKIAWLQSALDEIRLYVIDSEWNDEDNTIYIPSLLHEINRIIGTEE